MSATIRKIKGPTMLKRKPGRITVEVISASVIWAPFSAARMRLFWPSRSARPRPRSYSTTAAPRR